MTPTADRTAAHAPLLPHQRAGVEWLLNHPRALLADAPGLGKTVQAGEYLNRILDRSPAWPGVPALWLTEAALIQQTVTELERFFPRLGVAASTDPALNKLRPSAKALAAHAERFPFGPDVVVASYDWANSRLRDDSEQRPMLILDEASAVKAGPDGASWRTVRRLAGLADRVVALTATPLETNPCESWAILAAIHAPGLWSQATFQKDFVSWSEAFQMADGRWVPPKAEGFLPGMAAPFRRYLSGVSLRRTAAEAGLTLPTRVGEQHRLVPLSWKQQNEYDHWAKKQGLYGHSRRQRAGRIANNGASTLVDAAVAEVRQRTGQKVVVYAETLALLAALDGALSTAGISHESIDGSAARDARAASVAVFLDPASGVDVLIGSRVIEYGLNLQAARVLISLDPSYNPAREQQREGRICRIGSPHSTYEHLTLLPDTELNRRKLHTLDQRQQVQVQGGLA